MSGRLDNASRERLLAELSVDPSAVDDAALGPADLFCARAVLRYDDSDAPPRRAAAAALLTAESGLVDAHVWAAASAADPAALMRHLSAAPGLASTSGGPYGWVPLLYLCYSRVPLQRKENEMLDAVALLLDAGADPNAGYLWRGMTPPFTALTGAFGGGEQGLRRQPPHPFADAVATLLLQRGAHPVDQQTLYNRMFSPDDTHLELLFDHGLATAGLSPWELGLGAAMESRTQMWRRQINWAADHGFGARLQLLVRNGIDIGGAQPRRVSGSADPNTRDQDGATPLHHAAWDGDLARIRSLLDAGADAALTDREHDATPLQWAEYAYQNEAADLLRGYGH